MFFFYMPFSLLKCLNLGSEFFDHARKRLDLNTKINFKINDVVNREPNNYNT